MYGHGVIIGGGIGGLLAAHTLAGRFERVTVLECHYYPPDLNGPVPPNRRGVPQSRCIHLLMAAGAAAFDQLMPRCTDRLAALGAAPFDASADAELRFSAGSLPRTPSGVTAYACSRALLENVLLHGLSANPTVRVREGQKVLGIVTNTRGDRVTGVYTAERTDSGETTVSADVVIDASGAGSSLPLWISRLPKGTELQVQKTVVASCTQYVSRWFFIAPRDAPDWRCLSVAPTVGTALRSAMMLRAEDDRWGVVLLAPAGEPLPSDDESFRHFVAGLGDGELREVLARATPLSPIHRYGVSSNRMIHYDRLTAWPAGLFAIADSVCMLDPYFGLGMTAAARGAVLLGKWLDQRGGGAIPGLEFQNELASLNAEPWRLITGRDPDGRLIPCDQTHISRLHGAARSRPEVAHVLLAVQHLLRPAESLMEVAL